MWSSPGPRVSEGGRSRPWFRDEGGGGEGGDEEAARGRTFSDTEVGITRTQSGNNLHSSGSGYASSGATKERPAVVFKEGWAEKSARLRRMR